jgi:hypothetical protein
VGDQQRDGRVPAVGQPGHSAGQARDDNGGSAWASYWQQTIIELSSRSVASGELDDQSIDAFLAHCDDPTWWTPTMAFTVVSARPV